MKEYKPAFPTPDRYGMRERLYIATQIACAIISNATIVSEKTYNDVIRDAYMVADELIKREETK